MSKMPFKKISYIVLGIATFYFGLAIVFREYRMNPNNRYYGSYLPSATPLISTSEEESKKINEALFGKPNLLERIFTPAEAVFRWIEEMRTGVPSETAYLSDI